MKANQDSILLYGHDELVLSTRQWVLQSRGYRVLTVGQIEGFADIALSPPIRLLLLCHTLSPEESDAAIEAATARWPGVRSLALEVGGGRSPSGLLGQLLHTMDGPAKLIAAVNATLGDGAHGLPATRN